MLEKKIAKLKKETEDASNTQFAGGCLVYVLIIGLLSILGWWEDGDRGAIPASVIGLIICIFLSLAGFSRRFLSEKEKEQIDELKGLESRLEKTKRFRKTD